MRQGRKDDDVNIPWGRLEMMKLSPITSLVVIYNCPMGGMMVRQAKNDGEVGQEYDYNIGRRSGMITT